MSPSRPPLVQAAGGVLWRDAGADREIALVHRPRYDDWSLPKGKCKPGEELMLTAVREVVEETGHEPRVGPYLGQYSYPVTVAGRRAVKTVKYWSMQDTGGVFEPNDEVDEVVWLGADEAAERMRSPVDLTVLRAFRKLPAATSVLLLVRNGSAVRASKRVPSHKRSLDRRGRQQAEDLVPVLRTLGIDSLLSTDAERCRQTLQPYAAATALPVTVDAGLAGVRAGARVEAAIVADLLDRVRAGKRIAVCAEGTTTEILVAAVGAGLGSGTGRPAVKKGGWCLLHVGAGALLSMEGQQAA